MKKYALKLVIFSILLFLTYGVKVMLIGGALSSDQADIFQGILAHTNKIPYNCGQDVQTTRCPIMTVITSASQDEKYGINTYNNDDQKGLSFKHMFQKYGFFPVHILNHIDTYKIGSNLSTTVGQVNLHYIQIADAIFFNGGDQALHSRSWLNDDGSYNDLMNVIVQRAIKNQVILAGTSAGTMIMPKQTYGEGTSLGMWYFHNSVGLAFKNVSDGGVNGTRLMDQRNGSNCFQQQQNGGRMPGFNLVSFQTDSHINTRARVPRLSAKLLQLGHTIGVAVDQNTALLSIDSQIGYVYGQNGVTIIDVSNAKISETKYLTIDNVTLSFLTAKDFYDFKRNEVFSSKPLINYPKYDSFTDSEDILQQNQISLLLTRVMDQKPIFNVGKVKIPSYYPSNTPKFQMIFSRHYKSKGYYDGSIKVKGQERRTSKKKLMFFEDKQNQNTHKNNLFLQNSRYTISNITLKMTYT